MSSSSQPRRLAIPDGAKPASCWARSTRRLTLALQMRESEWIEPDRSLQPAVGFTAEEKLARLAEIVGFSELAVELTKIADRVTAIWFRLIRS